MDFGCHRYLDKWKMWLIMRLQTNQTGEHPFEGFYQESRTTLRFIYALRGLILQCNIFVFLFFNFLLLEYFL